MMDYSNREIPPDVDGDPGFQGYANGKDDVWRWVEAHDAEMQARAAEGRAKAAAEAAAKAEAEADSWKQLKVLHPADCEGIKPRPYVVKGLIGQGDVALLVGIWGSGKSLLAPHIGYGVAQGQPVFGHRVKQGPVVYLAAEDGHGMTQRVAAMKRRHGDAPDFHLLPCAMNLMDRTGADTKTLSGYVRHVWPALIIIDTLAISFPGIQENESEDMGHVVKVARDLAEICGSAVLIVHHVALSERDRPRGHGVLAGAADVIMSIEGTKNETRTVTLSKNRNGPSGTACAFSIDTEDMGTDEDGDAITAPVAKEEDRTERTKSKMSGMSGPQRTALEMLERAIIDTGKPSPASTDIPSGVLVVPLKSWRTNCFRSSAICGEGTGEDAKRKAFERAAKNLQDRKIVGIWDNFVWISARECEEAQ